MTSKNKRDKDPEKTVDLPPKGSRNPDPITDTPGSHPIEAGVGAAIGGAASGLAVGALTAGPVGAVVGAIAAGAVAGGYAGKGVGELIDPTTEDNWLREYWNDRDEETKRIAVAKSHEDYRPAYRYGLGSRGQHTGKTFDQAEADLEAGWDIARGDSRMTWDEARGAVRHAFDRTSLISRGEPGTLPADRQETVVGGRPRGDAR